VKPASFGHGCHFPTVTQGAIRIMRISPELFQEMLNRSISIVCPLRSMVNSAVTSFRPRTTQGYAAVVSRCLRLSTVPYGYLRSTTEEIKFLNMLKITPHINQDGGRVTVEVKVRLKQFVKVRI